MYEKRTCNPSCLCVFFLFYILVTLVHANLFTHILFSSAADGKHLKHSGVNTTVGLKHH